MSTDRLAELVREATADLTPAEQYAQRAAAEALYRERVAEHEEPGPPVGRRHWATEHAPSPPNGFAADLIADGP